MKTTKLFLIPAILAALTFASCSDYDNGFTVNQIKYDKAFIDAFGYIDPNQDWNLVKQLEEKNGRGTRTVNVNSDEWGTGKGSGSWIPAPPPSITPNQQAIVRLFFQNNKYVNGEAYPYNEFFPQFVYYFRNGRIDEGSAPDCKEKYYDAGGGEVSYSMNQVYVNGEYINNFSGANDGKAYVFNLEGSLYFQYHSYRSELYDNFVIISGETIDAWASANKDIIAKGRCLDGTTPIKLESLTGRWFVGFDFDMLPEEQVYEDRYFEYNGEKYHYISANKNQYCGDYKSYTDTNKPQGDAIGELLKEGYLPINDKEWVKITSCADGYYSDWILSITPGFPDKPIEPQPEDPDPEPKEEIIEAGLLCCEDLGGEEADFDFNDIVLKLEHKRVTTTENSAVSTKDIFVVTAMAAGGTLPSYVFYKPLKNADDFALDFADDWMHEAWNNGDGWVPFKADDDNVTNGVHDMWAHEDLSGQTSFEPLNVGQKFVREGHSWEVDITAAIEAMRAYENSNEEEQEEIRHYADHYVSYVFDRGRIRIYVNPVMNADGSVNTNDENSKYIEPLRRGGDSDVADENIVSQTPRMLLLPLRFEWPTESTFIGDAYQEFGRWVNDANITEWYLNKDDNSVTSRDVVGHEELQPRLRWGSNSDGATEEIYMSVSLQSGQSMTIPFTTLSSGGFSTSSSDQNVAEATTVNASGKTVTIKANNPGTATITLTQDAYSGANGDYRSESIMLYVTVEGNGTEPEKPKADRNMGNCQTFSGGLNTEEGQWYQGYASERVVNITTGKTFTITAYDYECSSVYKHSFEKGADLVNVSSNNQHPTVFTITAKETAGQVVMYLSLPETESNGNIYKAATVTKIIINITKSNDNNGKNDYEEYGKKLSTIGDGFNLMARFSTTQLTGNVTISFIVEGNTWSGNTATIKGYGAGNNEWEQKDFPTKQTTKTGSPNYELITTTLTPAEYSGITYIGVGYATDGTVVGVYVKSSSSAKSR